MLRSQLSSLHSRPNRQALALPCSGRPVHRSFSCLRSRRFLTGDSALGSTLSVKKSNGRGDSKGRSSKSQRCLYSTGNSPISTNIVYQGPLSRTFRSLKIFSLSSLGLASALTPFMFVIDTSLPNIARAALAITAMTTSGISTALVGWCGQPYVTTVRTLGDTSAKLSEGATSIPEGIQLETLTLTLKSRFTSVYDTSFLVETKRPMAKWELAETMVAQSSSPSSCVPQEETIAETTDAEGRVLGRWIVSWNEDRTKGACRGEGKIQRHFNVHEELLPPSIR